MTNEQFRAEKLYRASISLAQSMLEKDLVTTDEFAIIDRFLLDKYQPILGTLFSHIHLT